MSNKYHKFTLVSPRIKIFESSNAFYKLLYTKSGKVVDLEFFNDRIEKIYSESLKSFDYKKILELEDGN